MIDLHAHVLPGVDDGPPDWASAVAMLTMADLDGTEIIVATPHSHDFWRHEQPSRDLIGPLAEEANRRAREAGLRIQVLPGQECKIDSELVRELGEGRWRLLGDSNTVLLELFFGAWPPYTADICFDLRLAGYQVLLAHPERYRSIQDEPMRLFELVEQGVLTQVTSTSIEGRFGQRVQRTARLLMEHGLAHVIASDAHSTRNRHPMLSGARSQAIEWVGEEAAARMLEHTPRALLAGEPPDVPEPQPIEQPRRRWFKLF